MPADHEGNFCECCMDDLDGCNPFNQWMTMESEEKN